MPSHLALVMTTSTPATLAMENSCRKVVDWLTDFKIDHKVIDGADPDQKELRNELFNISGIRGKYPQVFITDKAESTEFIGDYEKIESLIEDNGIPAEVLAANPGILTFNKVFEKCKLT